MTDRYSSLYTVWVQRTTSKKERTAIEEGKERTAERMRVHRVVILATTPIFKT